MVDAISRLMKEDSQDDIARTIYKAGVVLGGHLCTEEAADALLEIAFVQLRGGPLKRLARHVSSCRSGSPIARRMCWKRFNVRSKTIPNRSCESSLAASTAIHTRIKSST